MSGATRAIQRKRIEQEKKRGLHSGRCCADERLILRVSNP
jgi:hypothetical protein